METAKSFGGTPTLYELSKAVLFVSDYGARGLAVTLGTLSLTALGLWRWHKRRELSWAGVCISWWLVAPVSAFAATLILDNNVFRPHNLLWTAPPLCIIMAVGLCRLPTRWALGILVLALCLNVPWIIDGVGDTRRGWDAAYESVSAQYREGDGVVFYPGYMEKGFFYYYHADPAPPKLNAYGWDLNEQIYEHGARHELRPLWGTETDYKDLDRLWVMKDRHLHRHSKEHSKKFDAYLEGWPEIPDTHEAWGRISVEGRAKPDRKRE